MKVELILLALSPIFILFVVYEFVKHRQLYDIKDSINNTVLALLHQGADAISLIILLPFFYWLYEFRIFNIETNVFTLIAAFLLQDFLYYWFHRASHHIHWLWAAHVVHHSSTRMNFTTAFRQSLMYPIAGMWLFWTPMMLLGYEPELVLAVVALNLAYQFFVHTETMGSLGKYGLIFNTPSHHRVHHSTNKQYIDKNFAGVLIIWDKLFGTFVAEDPNIKCKYGIVGQIESNNPLYISLHQWIHMFKRFNQAKGFKQKWQCIFGYPSH